MKHRFRLPGGVMGDSFDTEYPDEGFDWLADNLAAGEIGHAWPLLRGKQPPTFSADLVSLTDVNRVTREYEQWVEMLTAAEQSRRDCRVCGGSGWTDGSAEINQRRHTGPPDTTCVGCNGTGIEGDCLT